MMPIQASDRVFITGKTGTGKTTLAQRLLRRVQRWVYLDPKHMGEMGKIPIYDYYDPTKDRQIIRLPKDRADGWESIISEIYREGDTVIYIDELTALTPTHRLPAELGWTIRTGRQRNVGVWAATQRPKEIPSALFTESEHFMIFRLKWDEDRKKMISMTSSELEPYIAPKDKQNPRGLDRYDFVYYHEGGDDWFQVQQTPVDKRFAL